MTGNKLNELQLIEEFESIKPDLQRVGKIIDKELMRLISVSLGLKSVNLEIKPKFNIKTNESLIKKAFYRGKDYNHPLKEITDKVRTRIVVTSREEQKAIQDAIKNNTDFWEIVEEKNEYDFNINEEKFSYCAVHFLIKPKNNGKFIGINESKIDFYICEIQLKTLLQHAWAQISHDTIYKGEFQYDKELKRLMSQAMALMEVTDEQFIQAKNIMKQQSRQQKACIDSIIEISKQELKIKFDASKVDRVVSKEIFELSGFTKDFTIEDLRLCIKGSEIVIGTAINSLHSYFKNQPVVLLIIYLIQNRQDYKLEAWDYEQDVLNEIKFSLGYSC